MRIQLLNTINSQTLKYTLKKLSSFYLSQRACQVVPIGLFKGETALNTEYNEVAIVSTVDKDNLSDDLDSLASGLENAVTL